jgi:hypothetical protein
VYYPGTTTPIPFHLKIFREQNGIFDWTPAEPFEHESDTYNIHVIAQTTVNNTPVNTTKIIPTTIHYRNRRPHSIDFEKRGPDPVVDRGTHAGPGNGKLNDVLFRTTDNEPDANMLFADRTFFDLRKSYPFMDLDDDYFTFEFGDRIPNGASIDQKTDSSGYTSYYFTAPRGSLGAEPADIIVIDPQGGRTVETFVLVKGENRENATSQKCPDVSGFYPNCAPSAVFDDQVYLIHDTTQSYTEFWVDSYNDAGESIPAGAGGYAQPVGAPSTALPLTNYVIYELTQLPQYGTLQRYTAGNWTAITSTGGYYSAGQLRYVANSTFFNNTELKDTIRYKSIRYQREATTGAWNNPLNGNVGVIAVYDIFHAKIEPQFIPCECDCGCEGVRHIVGNAQQSLQAGDLRLTYDSFRVLRPVVDLEVKVNETLGFAKI